MLSGGKLNLLEKNKYISLTKTDRGRPSFLRLQPKTFISNKMVRVPKGALGLKCSQIIEENLLKCSPMTCLFW